MKESKNLNLSTVATHKNKQSRSNPCKPSLGMPSAMFAVCNQVNAYSASWDTIDPCEIIQWG